MTMTLLIWHQLDYFQNLLREDSVLGSDLDQVVVVHNRGLTMDQARIFKTELLQDSRIAAVSLSSTVPGKGSRATYGVKPEGVEGEVGIRVYQVDGDFVEIMGLRMSEGRAFTDEPADAQAIIINEAAAKRIGWTEPLGKTIFGFQGRDRRVVGVIEDFHFPHSKIEPLLMAPFGQWAWAGTIIVLLDAALKVSTTSGLPSRPIAPSSAILSKVFAGLYSVSC